MKTRFICNVSNARLLRNRIDKYKGFEAEYVIERVVYLSKREFIPFRENLLVDDPNIALYQDDMFIDENEVFHVLMFCCMQCDIMLLVYSDGENYAKYCSIKSNGGKKVEPRFTVSQRYSKQWKIICWNAIASEQNCWIGRQVYERFLKEKARWVSGFGNRKRPTS